MFKKVILIFISLLFILSKSYANDLDISDSTKTIRELKENIEWLDKAKNELYIKLKDFAPDQKLKSYFREDLSITDLESLKQIIDEYNKNKSILDINLLNNSKQLLDTSDIRVKLLEEKKELYKKITSFIKSEYYQDYLEYIKSDTTIYSERKEIDSDIYRKQEIINNKVIILEEKIKEHKSYLEDSLQKLVEEKMEEKISFLSQNESFSKLSTDEKINILNKTISKLQLLIENLNLENYNSDLWNFIKSNNNKKIEIYKIVLLKLQNFKNDIK